MDDLEKLLADHRENPDIARGMFAKLGYTDYNFYPYPRWENPNTHITIEYDYHYHEFAKWSRQSPSLRFNFTEDEIRACCVAMGEGNTL